ncbi:hypothetical protein AGMMS50267_08400 [Spirochaetia bacterium]|nr:hypothetical protein AGMMS50267_08400 [Spirochaetia bacterium]
MTIEQTVEIPENHRIQVFFDIPYNVPAGRQVKVALDLSQEEKAEQASSKQASSKQASSKQASSKQASFKKGDWRRLCGISAGSAGTDRILRDRAREALIDEAQFAEKHGTEIAPTAVERAAKWGITVETLKAKGEL